MTKLRKDEYLNLARAARRLGVSYRNLKRMIEEGKIPYRQPGPRTYRISSIELDQWIRNKNYPARHQPEVGQAFDEQQQGSWKMSSDKDQKFYPGGWTPEQWEQASNFKQPVGFPWALVIQILMAILSYLMQRASTKPERDHFAHLKTELGRWEVK